MKKLILFTIVICPLLMTAQITIDQTLVHVACKSAATGTITITAAGGTSPYTYLWNTEATTDNIGGLTAGTYEVTVTDAELTTGTENFSITEPEAALAVTLAQTNETIYGGATGSITAAVTGGTTAYTYLWTTAQTSSSISTLTAGIYTLTVTDGNACTTTGTATITQPAATITAGPAGNFFILTNYAENITNASTKYYGLTKPLTYGWGYSLAVYIHHVSGTADSTHVELQGSFDGTTFVSIDPVTPLLQGTAAWYDTYGSIGVADGSFLYLPTETVTYPYLRVKVQHYATGVVTAAAFLYLTK